MRLNVSPCATHVEEVNNYTHGINTSDSVFTSGKKISEKNKKDLASDGL